MKAMLFAAGLGTRLRPLTNDKPKALVEVNGQTLLERNIRYLASFGVTEIVVNIHHFADKMRYFIENLDVPNVELTISDESDVVLETGGGLYKARNLLGNSPFLVMNVDILTDFNIHHLIKEHNNNEALVTFGVTDREGSRSLLLNEDMLLCGWKHNTTGEIKISRNSAELIPYSFSCVYMISPSFFDHFPGPGKYSIIDVFLEAAKTVDLKGLDHSGDLLIDVGKPDSLALAKELVN